VTYETIRVHFQESICFIQIHRPTANNTINGQLVTEIGKVMSECEKAATVIVLSGSSEVFCFGADFKEISLQRDTQAYDPAALYDLWLRLATGPYVTIAHVRGKVNAGGVGFAVACDIILADETAHFSLSELLFGLYPACVLPFLVRRVGLQKAHYLTLMTQPISARQASAWGLVDACDPQSDTLVRNHLQRLRRLSKPAIQRYKTYMASMEGQLSHLRGPAVEANRLMFSDPDNINAIARYVDHGLFPWEAGVMAPSR
jgi:polyketide biosynthesis enoyl-CoA hydratase PksH